jgi:hypothetical protein
LRTCEKLYEIAIDQSVKDGRIQYQKNSSANLNQKRNIVIDVK